VKRSWLYALTAILLVAAGVAAYSFGRILGDARSKTELGGTALQTPVALSDVTLETPQGRFQFADLKGKVVVVFFGYVRCPDVCPLTMSHLASIYKDIGSPKDLQVVMVTTDPANDTPEITQTYAAGFDPSFIGLSGDNTQIATAAQRFFIGYNTGAGGQIVHTDPVLVLDRNGAMQRVYSQASLLQLQQDLPKLLETL
jgi:protein SCO1